MTRCCSISCCCFWRSRTSRKGRRDDSEFWRSQLSCCTLVPYVIVLSIISSAETAVYHYLTPHSAGYVDSAYTVALAIFTIGGPKVGWHGHSGRSAQALLLAFAFVWLCHLACLWHAFSRQRMVFKRFLFAWLHKNKEDALFIKLSLLQPIGRRPALADRLMSKCTEGSLYRRLLFCTLTLDDKVTMCRHLTWKPDRSEVMARSAHISPNGPGHYNAGVQVDLDKDVCL